MDGEPGREIRLPFFYSKESVMRNNKLYPTHCFRADE